LEQWINDICAGGVQISLLIELLATSLRSNVRDGLAGFFESDDLPESDTIHRLLMVNQMLPRRRSSVTVTGVEVIFPLEHRLECTITVPLIISFLSDFLLISFFRYSYIFYNE